MRDQAQQVGKLTIELLLSSSQKINIGRRSKIHALGPKAWEIALICPAGCQEKHHAWVDEDMHRNIFSFDSWLRVQVQVRDGMT